MLRDAGRSAAADPLIIVPPPLPQSPATPERPAVPAQSLTALTSELHSVERTAETAEILRELLDDRFGALAEVKRLIQTTATWCERLNTDKGREVCTRLRTAAEHMAFLGDRIADIEADLDSLPALIPADAPQLATTPARKRDSHPPRYGHRAQAATSTSPHRPLRDGAFAAPVRTATSPQNSPGRAR